MPDAEPYITTEEDFRTYESRYAPFVNEFRVSLMENIFCLFGFSGDDPNFLQWTGWVRDRLSHSAPFIYWFHNEPNLPTFQLRMLEDRRIVPMHLGSLFPESKDDGYFALFSELFRFFRELEDPSVPYWNRPPRTSAALLGTSNEHPRP